ncbi:hypothetical protein IOD16_30950 [Saccharothrix sp. 6-C]|uniref:phospholipase D-like domain-containing protein n=1 Tax=Saccharothrix sp. 6-C TaxID=2781735 RepID=UPI0019178BD5|nr:phospholipase D-like domain-containing protein [Saccharothrix sp. 6-C]QQQ75472.1 hypothetical protein IOD16_30950 [Saccharothrix sp. 6-C]
MINKARVRVVIVALLWGYDSVTSKLFDALRRSANRGVSIHVVIDGVYSRAYYTGRRSYYRRAIQSLDQLAQVGVTVNILGSSSVNPLRGRCHAKFAVVDDYVFGFGGVNIARKATQNVDYMIGKSYVDTADSMQQFAEDIATGAPVVDKVITVDNMTSVLLDGGVQGSSVIYNEACRLASMARRVIYVSQFAPTGRLAGLLHRTDAVLYFNRSLQSAPPVALMLTADKMIGGTRTAYRRESYLHAKFMLVELGNGSRVVLSGSHNFKMQGVRYGTVEIAIRSSDVQLYTLIENFYRAHIA